MQHTASLGHAQQSRKSSTIVAGVGAAMVATAVTFAMLSSSSSAPVATTPTTEAPAKECRNVPPADAVCRNHKRRRHGSLPRRQLPFASDHAFDRTAARDISARAFANHDDRGTRDDRRAGDRSRDYFAVERCAARVSGHQWILGAHGNVVAFQGLLESVHLGRWLHQVTETVTRKKVAVMDVLSLLWLLFSRSKRASISFCRSPARSFFDAASKAFMVGP